MAENLATVTACVTAISSTLASLPALVYRRSDTGRTEAPTHPVARLIRRPNSRQTWPDWLEMMASQVLLWGNAISVIEFDGAGRVTGLLPIPWCNVMMSLLPSGRIAYDISNYIAPWGGTGEPRRYMDDEVFHLRDRSDDGYVGRSRLSRAPEMLSQASALQDYSSGVWRNFASPSGAIKHPGKLSNDAKTNIADSFERRHAGPHNAKRSIILDEGMDWVPLSVSPEDAEVLASRRFTVEELCRLFNVPPPIIQDYSHGTFTNAAQAGLWFAQLTLLPWVKKVEAEFARSVFGEGSEFHLELDLSGLTRGDFAARWTANVAAVQAGILTKNEIREAEGYDRLPEAGEVVPGSKDTP
jgi:HK97 family phage portal protein